MTPIRSHTARPTRTPRTIARAAAAALGATVLTGTLLVPLTATGAPGTPAPPQGTSLADATRAADTGIVPDGPEPVEVVPVTVPDRDALDDLVATGADLNEAVDVVPLGLRVDAYLTPSEQAAMNELGFRTGDPVLTQDEADALAEEQKSSAAAAADAESEALADGDELRIQRAAWLDDAQGDFIEVEVWSQAGSASSGVVLDVAIDAGEGTEIGDGGTFTLSRFQDAGQYMYHTLGSPRPVDDVPARMRVTSTVDGEVVATEETAFTEYLDGELPEGPGAPGDWSDIATGFVDHYVDPTEAYERIESLAAEFPDLAEIVELPEPTGGYQRKAMHLTSGVPANAAVNVTSDNWGHEGGNALTVEYADPGTPGSPLDVTTDGTDITVSLATDDDGTLVSTAADVVDAINASDAPVTAQTYRGNAGAGTVRTSGPAGLSDFLSAPDSVERGPSTMKVLRIGKHRDGSRTGVYLYSQEHAREWVTPITALETAERLLRNYESSTAIADMVDDLDIFLLPVTNPDGAHYSMHDFTFQRKNLTNHCPADGTSDANARNSWGVDINRNFRAGSISEGYTGASTVCTSEVFAGPEPLSEPEARNEVWLVENHPNIKFSMNTHTHGGYFMWAPGSYKAAGRETNERPSMGTEEFFYDASDLILNRIEEHRGTVLWPSRVGPIADVLYSAAGNSADEFYYNYGVYSWSFEAGAPRWNGSSWESVGFTPPYAEGHEEAMEFSNGWLGILEVARLYSADDVEPTAELTPDDGTYPEPVDVTWEISEAADVYYTLDGSRPTYASERLELEGPRQGIESLTITETTTISWFAVDAAGNVSDGYDPEGDGEEYSEATITIGGS
ncbi:M14 family zinc carboxypeptidase [Myceligenerans cantabricum]